jgi:hypothetical protein
MLMLSFLHHETMHAPGPNTQCALIAGRSVCYLLFGIVGVRVVLIIRCVGTTIIRT